MGRLAAKHAIGGAGETYEVRAARAQAKAAAHGTPKSGGAANSKRSKKKYHNVKNKQTRRYSTTQIVSMISATAISIIGAYLYFFSNVENNRDKPIMFMTGVDDAFKLLEIIRKIDHGN